MQSKKSIISRFTIVIFCIFLLLGLNESTFSQTRNLAKFETAKSYFKKGFHFFNEMKYLAAVEYFRKAITEYPEYYTAREYLARSYKLSGFVDEALKEWEILANAMSNSVSIVNKINNINFREIQGNFSIGSSEFLFSDEYNPTELGRFRFHKPVDIAVDSEKNLYISSFSAGKLVKLDLNGKGISIFNIGVGSRLYGVDCFEDKICLSNFKDDSVYILNTDFDILKTFGSSGKDVSKFHGPEGVSFDKSGNIYVVDSRNHRIQKFDREGNFILKFGKYGEYEGQLKNPSHVAVQKDTVYLTDTGNNRIACFDESGNFIRNITVEGLLKPRGIDIYNNNLIISDEKNGLLFYGLDDEKIDWLNSWDNNKRAFSKLISADSDRDGNLYCLDYNYESVFVFSPIQSRYNNLDIEVTSVDIRQYPTVAFNLNIRNRNGKPVYGLRQVNFKVTEDSANITGFGIDYFRDVEQSVSLILCVDRSNQTRGYHYDIPWVSDFVLKKMKKNDALRVLNFNKDSWIGNDFDWSRRRTIRALKKRSYAKEKSIGKCLYNAITDLLPRVNRRGIILVSDGSVDSTSFQQYTIRNIIEYAKSHYIPIYFIVFKKKDPVLQRIARETGGGIYKANELNGMRKIYDNIKSSEEYRYVLIYSTFKSTPVKGWWSDVKIEVNYKGQGGVEYGGYFVP